MNIVLLISLIFLMLTFYLTIKNKETFLQWLLLSGMLSIIVNASYLGSEKLGLPNALFKIIKYADEIAISLVLALAPFTPGLRIKIDKYIGLIIAFALTGMVSAVLYGRELTTVFLASFLTLKPFLIFVAFRTLKFQVKPGVKVKVLNTLFYIVLLGGIIDVLFARIYRPLISNYGNEMRFGINYVSGVFWHPSSQSILASLLVIYYSSFFKYTRETIKSSDRVKYLMLSFFVVWATRVKQIVGLILAVAMRELSVKKIILGIVVGIALFMGYKTVLPTHYNQYIGTVNVDKNARQALSFTSVKIAKDYFPLGTGFGTFASPVSRDYYSPVYDQYGLSNIWGLSREMGAFICDTFWPMVIGENGVLGFIIYLIFWILVLYEIVYKQEKNQRTEFFSMYFIFIFITSLATTALLNNEGYVLFAVAGYLLNPNRLTLKGQTEGQF